MFNGAANGSSHHQSTNNSKVKANNTTAHNATGDTFQIKPMKQRTHKKHSICTLL